MIRSKYFVTLNLGIVLQSSVQFSSVTQSCPTICDPMNGTTPGLPVHHQLPEFTQTRVHRETRYYPPPTSHPISSLWISPSTSPKHAVSCIEHRLAIRFLHDSMHVSMPFSQIILPPPSPTESKSLFYTSVSLYQCFEFI